MATEIGQDAVIATDAPIKEYTLQSPPADKWKPQPKVMAVGVSGGITLTTVSSAIILAQKFYPHLTFTMDEMAALVFLTGGLFWVIQTIAGYLKVNR